MRALANIYGNDGSAGRLVRLRAWRGRGNGLCSRRTSRNPQIISIAADRLPAQQGKITSVCIGREALDGTA